MSAIVKKAHLTEGVVEVNELPAIVHQEHGQGAHVVAVSQKTRLGYVELSV